MLFLMQLYMAPDINDINEFYFYFDVVMSESFRMSDITCISIFIKVLLHIVLISYLEM